MIALFGAPGSGKSVQANMLQRKYGWYLASSRELFMGLRDRDVTRALQYGMTFDDEKAFQAMRGVFAQAHNSRRQIVLDGFPTSVQQVYWMIEHNELKNLTGAIILDVPRGELWRRLVERKRVDDTRAAIERRQNSYERTITGMTRVLEMNGVYMRKVDGRNTPGDVLERIEEVLSEWGLIARKDFEHIEPKQSVYFNR